MTRTKRTGLELASLCLATFLFLGTADAARRGKPAPSKAEQDIQVTVVMSNGTERTYGPEVRQLQLVMSPDGRIDVVHLVLASGGEDTDTHVWFNFSALAGISYRYLSITGRAKVSVLRRMDVAAESEVRLEKIQDQHERRAEDMRSKEASQVPELRPSVFQ